MAAPLKNPEESYQPRLSRFLALMLKVKNLKPLDLHLWRVMDSVAFQDTETALETALHNERRSRKKQNS
jgi:hypothetical protein